LKKLRFPGQVSLISIFKMAAELLKSGAAEQYDGLRTGMIRIFLGLISPAFCAAKLLIYAGLMNPDDVVVFRGSRWLHDDNRKVKWHGTLISNLTRDAFCT
jgi:hypothetical protein